MIRSYRQEDTEALAEIWQAASLRAHNFIKDTYWLSKVDEIKNIWLPVAKTLVWEENERPVAFISVIDGECIGGLFVDPVWQGKGIGSRLLTAVQAECSRLRLSVYAKNLSAVSFYARHGFCEELKGVDEETGEEELLMIWQRPLSL